MTNAEAQLVMPEEKEAVETLYKTECITREGVGYGAGSISARRESHPEFPVSHEQLDRALDILTDNFNEVLVDVDEDDDGCGDGRPTAKVFSVIDGRTGEVREYKKSKNRAKIFGGGLQVAGSMWRAVSGQPQHQETVLGDRKFVAGELDKRGIKYGVHIDTHAHGDNCGCGAIDKYQQSVDMSGEFRGEIAATLPVFYGESLDENQFAVAQTFGVRKALAADTHYMSDAAGKKTMDFAGEDGAVVKSLDGPHLEMITILNDEPGKTVSQEKVAELFRRYGLPEGIQVFVVDAWRGAMYADVVAEIARETIGADGDDACRIAFADFLVNQLSVAATLTDGSQPIVYHREA